MKKYTSYKILSVLIFAAGLLLIQGCSKTFEGEAFHDNGKYRGVKIYIIDAKVASAILNNGEKEINIEKQKIIEKIKKLDWKEINEKYNSYSTSLTAGLVKFGNLKDKSTWSYSQASAFTDASDEKYTIVMNTLAKELKKINIKELGADFNGLKTNEFYSKKLQPLFDSTETPKTSTDSEGKFNVKGESNSYIVAITHNKNLFWIINPSLTKEKLQLTKNNLVSEKCAECVSLNEDADINNAGGLAMFIYYAVGADKKIFMSKDDFFGMIDSAKKAGF